MSLRHACLFHGGRIAMFISAQAKDFESFLGLKM